MRQTPYYMTLEPCVCVTRMRRCAKYAVSALCNRKMCVQQVSVCTHPVVHTVLATTCVRNTKKLCWDKLCQEKMTLITPWPPWQKNYSTRRLGSEPIRNHRLHHSMSVLIFLTRTCSISWLFINHGEWRLLVSRGMRLWETDLPNLLIFDDAFVWTLSNGVKSIQSIWASWGSSRHIICGFWSASSIHANNGPLSKHLPSCWFNFLHVARMIQRSVSF